MINTIVQYTVKVQYSSEPVDAITMERRKDNLENALEHCRQANMLGALGDDVNWVEVVNDRVITETPIDETKDY